MRMKFLVIINEQSPAGKALLLQSHLVKMGAERHIGLFCKEVDAANPHYLHVKTIPVTTGAAPQSLHLPHDCVLLISAYEDEDEEGDAPPKLPMGFLPG
jgi:hypothetical protein